MSETPLEYVARICELEARLLAMQQQRDELLTLVEQVEWINVGHSGEFTICNWCKADWPDHALDCSRQATLARVRGGRGGGT